MKKRFSLFLALFITVQCADAVLCVAPLTEWTGWQTNSLTTNGDTVNFTVSVNNVLGLYGSPTFYVYMDSTNVLAKYQYYTTNLVNFTINGAALYDGSNILGSVQISVDDPALTGIYTNFFFANYRAHPSNSFSFYTTCSNATVVNYAVLTPSRTNTTSTSASFVTPSGSLFYYTNTGVSFPSNTWSLAAASFGMTNGDYKLVNSNGVLVVLYMDGGGSIVYTNPFLSTTIPVANIGLGTNVELHVVATNNLFGVTDSGIHIQQNNSGHDVNLYGRTTNGFIAFNLYAKDGSARFAQGNVLIDSGGNLTANSFSDPAGVLPLSSTIITNIVLGPGLSGAVSGGTLFVTNTSTGGGITNNASYSLTNNSIYAGVIYSTNGGTKIIDLSDTTGVTLGKLANGTNNGVSIGIGSSGYVGGFAGGYYANGTNYGVAVGPSSIGFSQGVGIGYFANGAGNGVSIGYNSGGWGSGVSIGYASEGTNSGTAVGYFAKAAGGIAIGASSTAYGGISIGNAATTPSGFHGIALGDQATGGSYGVALGYRSFGTNYGVAIGANAVATNSGNIAIGGDPSTPAKIASTYNGSDAIELGRGTAITNGLSLFGLRAFDTGLNGFVSTEYVTNAVWVKNVAVCPAPIAGGSWFWPSNGVLFWVTTTHTNYVSGP